MYIEISISIIHSLFFFLLLKANDLNDTKWKYKETITITYSCIKKFKKKKFEIDF